MKRLLCVMACWMFALTAGAQSEPVEHAEADVQVAKRMPSFALRDLNGVEVRAGHFQGKSLLVVFWLSTDRNCRQQMPVLVDLQKAFGGTEFTVIGIALDPAGPEGVKTYVREQGVNFPVLMADYKTVQDFGGLRFVPTAFVIDKNHNIISKYEGQTEKKTFADELKAIVRK